MILYHLRCRRGHDFEAWFRNGDTYDSQQASGDVSCPFCGTAKVAKAPMAPNISTRAGGGLGKRSERDDIRANEVAAKILQAVDGMRAEVEENCDYVGDDFADEARAIHYGDSEERAIYGEATDEEAEELEDEDINFFRLPFPRRRND